MKKGVLRNFGKFTGKHLCLSLFLNKVAGLIPATLFKKRLWRRGFPVNFAKFLRTLLFIEHLWWLLLHSKGIIRDTRIKASVIPHKLFPRSTTKGWTEASVEISSNQK